MRLHSFLMLCVVTLLAACGGSSEVRRLEGERITINYQRSAIMADSKALETKLNLPTAVTQSHWGQVGGHASHSIGHVTLSKNLDKLWSRSLGGGNTEERKIFSAPVYAEGLVFASNTDGEIYAVSEKKGKVVWDVEKESLDGEELNYAPALAVRNGVLYAALSSGEVVALDAKTGEEKWSATVGLPLRSAPSVDDKHVYVITYNNAFYALDAKTGTLKWTHNGIEEGLAILGGPSAAISSEGVVIVPYSSGEIYALNQQNGSYIWHDALSVNVGSDLYSSLVDVEASPVVADGVVYAVNHNGQLSAFNLQNGRRYWSVPVSATQMPWVAGSVLYIVTENDELICLNRRDGLVRWIKKLNKFLEDDYEENIYWAGPVLAGGRLIVTSSTGEVLEIDPFEGNLLNSFEAPDAVSLPAIVAGKRLILLTDEARLVAFD